MQANNSSSIISLPKGGGALSGLGEKFSPDLHTGTGNFSVPIPLPPGRNGFQPQLALAYSTGTGNGTFGLGCNLSVPAITRKTSHGIPRYNEHSTGDSETDVFLLSGSEDLVKVSGAYPGRVRYRPRTEGLFARIEHVRESGANYWEVRTKDGLLSRYGARLSPGAAVSEPAITRDPASEWPDRIFCWKLTETLDPFGNLIVYDYLRDSGDDRGHRWDQPLLNSIKYADYGDRDNPSFLIRVEFLYERRPDPFSEYRSGFEIRTSLRCHKIQVSTQTADGIVHPVREFRLLYEQDQYNWASLLAGIEVFAFDDGGQITDKPVLPPLSFGYTRFEPHNREFKTVTGQALPAQSLSAADMDLVDLHGNGLPDIIEMNGVVRYWRNLGGGQFDWPRQLQDAPPHRLSDPGVQFIDADGDGRADLLVTATPLGGYYPTAHSAAWSRKSFQPYAQAPTVSFEDPEVKLLDLDGNGITDVLRSGARFECFFNDPNPQRAWARTAVVERQDLEHFPNVNFSDPRIRLADMSGDGLQDIVAIHDGLVEYWPNLGHGQWGRRIVMRRSPRLPYNYDPQRLLLGDVDGDGLADVIYVDHGRVLLWMNQSGNAWSARPVVISGTPPMANNYSVRLIDLEGTGVAGLLWSRDADVTSRDNLRFLDFTGGRKPYLLNRIDNNLGAETRVAYRPSTQDFLRDVEDPLTRWRTPLPFPVQVVAKVEVIDRLSRGKLTTEYRYHHGYWDGAEREFRGFGMVEQFDTERFEDYNGAGLHGQDLPFEDFSGADRQRQFSPPTLTTTWFHQGPVGDEFGNWQELDYRSEFWQGDPTALSRPDAVTEWLDQLPRRVKRDALRTLRGRVLRTELYALDGTEREHRPYTVTEAVFGVREESPPGAGEQSRRCVFFPFLLAQRATGWERGADPQTQLSFAGDYDSYGHPRKQLTVAVPRHRDYRFASEPTEPYLATCSETLYAQRDESDHYMVDRVARLASYEVINRGQETAFQLWDRVYLGDASLSAIGLELRYYDGPTFEGLPLQQLGEYGAVTRIESLVLTEEIVRQAYRADDVPEQPPYLNPNPSTVWTDEYPAEVRMTLPNVAGYVYCTSAEHPSHVTGYYVVSDRRRYDVHGAGGDGRGLVTAMRDPLGHETTVSYDLPYWIYPVEVTDPVGLTTTARLNYRTLQPESVTNANGNTTRVTFNALGLVDATYVQGKAGEGDQQRPSIRMEYDLLAFAERRQPASVRAIRYVHHDMDTDVALPQRDETIDAVEYSDGFGRLLQTRTQAADVLFGDPAFGLGTLPANQSQPIPDAVGRSRTQDDSPNVIVSGWQVYDNKGRVVEQYEPFFAAGWNYAPPSDQQRGRKIRLEYDPRGQMIRAINPDGSEQRVIFGVPQSLDTPHDFAPTPWEVYTYDANDLAPLSSDPNGTALATSAPVSHHFTPSSAVLDALGRTIETVARNGVELEHWYITRSTYDIRGNVLSTTDAMGRAAFRYTYDFSNRPWRIESIDAGTRRIVLDAAGNQIERRDSKGGLVLEAFDPLNRASRMWARDDSTVSPPTLRQRMEYGDGGRPDQDTQERAASFAKNLLGTLYRHHDEAGLLTIVSVDFKGNANEKIRRVIADTHILKVFESAPRNKWRVEAFRVDWTATTKDRLDALEAAVLDPAEYSISAAYDALNRVKITQYPLDVEGRRKTLRPTYNRAGNVESVSLEGTTYVDRVAYDAKGQRTLIAYGNGVMTRYAYDPQSFRLTRLRSERYAKSGGLTYHPSGPALQDYGYSHDLAGNLGSITDRTPASGFPNNPQAGSVSDPELAELLASSDALIRHFEYDPIYRLVSATGRECDLPPDAPPWLDQPRCTDHTRTRGYSERYRYDASGNMLSLQHQNGPGSFTRNFTVEQETNRLRALVVGQTLYAYEYDGNGNMTAETSSRRFDWDHADQLKAFRTQTEGAEPSIHAHYLYDATGQRVKTLARKQGGRIQVTVYIDELFEHLRLVDGPAVSENNTLHVMDDRSRVALLRTGQPVSDDVSPAITYQLGDHLGSSNVIVDDAGEWVRRQEFTPFGESTFGGFAQKRYRFTGKERDEESGFAYHQARYYISWLARWISCDPFGPIDGSNLYLYVRNDPVRLTDYRGTQPDEREIEMALQDVLQRFGRGVSNEIANGVEPNKAYGRALAIVRPEIAEIIYILRKHYSPIEIVWGETIPYEERMRRLQQYRPNIEFEDDARAFFLRSGEQLPVTWRELPRTYGGVWRRGDPNDPTGRFHMWAVQQEARRDYEISMPRLTGLFFGAATYFGLRNLAGVSPERAAAAADFSNTLAGLYSAHRTALSGATIRSTGSLENLGAVYQGPNLTRPAQGALLTAQPTTRTLSAGELSRLELLHRFRTPPAHRQTVIGRMSQWRLTQALGGGQNR
jgi:RHS repeat-associated protein